MNSIQPNANPNATEPDVILVGAGVVSARDRSRANGVMTMLIKMLAAVAAATVLATIAFAKAARGASHRRSLLTVAPMPPKRKRRRP